MKGGPTNSMSQTPRNNPNDPYKGQNQEPPDPSQRLQQLQTELADQQRRLDHINKQTQALQSDITDLEASVAEVKSTLTAYGSQLQSLETQFQGLQYFYDQKHKMIMAAIGDRRMPIDNLVGEYDLETAESEERLEELSQRLAAAQRASDEAGANQTAKQASYDSAKGYAQDVQNKLSDLATLRTQITQADNTTDTASMYFLVLEFQNTLHGTDIVSQHQLAQQLKHALGELEEAREQARIKSAELGHIQNEHDAQQDVVSGRKQNRRTQLLAEVQKMFPAPAQAAASGSASSTTTAGSATAPAASSTSAVTAAVSAPPATQKK